MLWKKSFECCIFLSTIVTIKKNNNLKKKLTKHRKMTQTYIINHINFIVFLPFSSVFNSSSNLLKFFLFISYPRTLKKMIQKHFSCVIHARTCMSINIQHNTRVNKNINNILFIVIKNFENMNAVFIFRSNYQQKLIQYYC